MTYRMMRTDELRCSSWNPNTLTAEEFERLVDEVDRHNAVLKPIVVRLDENGQGTIIDGEHNYLAACRACLMEVPVEVVDLDDFHARRETWVRNLSGKAHPVKLGRMWREMLELQSRAINQDVQRAMEAGSAGYGVVPTGPNSPSNRSLAKWLGVSEGTVRNMLLYDEAHRAGLGTEDELAKLTVRQLRKLLSGQVDEDQAPDEAEQEPRILARLKRAWNKATEPERSAFIRWTGALVDVERASKVQELKIEAMSPAPVCSICGEPFEAEGAHARCEQRVTVPRARSDYADDKVEQVASH